MAINITRAELEKLLETNSDSNTVRIVREQLDGANKENNAEPSKEQIDLSVTPFNKREMVFVFAVIYLVLTLFFTYLMVKAAS